MHPADIHNPQRHCPQCQANVRSVIRETRGKPPTFRRHCPTCEHLFARLNYDPREYQPTP